MGNTALAPRPHPQPRMSLVWETPSSDTRCAVSFDGYVHCHWRKDGKLHYPQGLAHTLGNHSIKRNDGNLSARQTAVGRGQSVEEPEGAVSAAAVASLPWLPDGRARRAGGPPQEAVLSVHCTRVQGTGGPPPKLQDLEDCMVDSTPVDS